MSVLQPPPRRNATGLGSSPFARHYLGNSYWSLLLGVLRCFSSPGSPSLRSNQSKTGWVAPFGHPRITGRLRLPADFRSLPRPSSPLDAQASTHAPLFTFSFHKTLSYFVFAIVPFTVTSNNSSGLPGGACGGLREVVPHFAPVTRAFCMSFICGEYRIRTDDPLLAKQVL
jgi:hypothetical protein